jgi:hypothetical protein
VTPLIVVILAVAWIAVLLPPLLRSRTDDRPATSVGTFRQQLATLSRTEPARRAAYRNLLAVPNRATGRLTPGRMAPPRYEYEYDDDDGYPSGRGDGSGPSSDDGYRRRPAGYRGAGAYGPARGAGYQPGRGVVPGGRGGPRPLAPVGYPGRSMRSARADVRRRRQNVLVGLLAAAAVTALGGFAFGVGVLVGINLVIDALLVFYLYLLVQLRRAEEVRAMRTGWSKAA